MDAVVIGEDGLTAEVQAPAVGEEDLTGTLDRGNLPGNSDC